jgi:methylglyoxal/glyoxal reductase
MKIASLADCLTLNNGVKMPRLGLGVLKSQEGGEVESAVKWALEAGYRHIDTAAIYGNEKGVGRALKEFGLPREEIFLTTKLWNEDMRQHRATQAFQESLDRLQVDYVDLYLIHWPVKGCYVEAWRAMQDIYKSGRARAIGVSNFKPHQIEDLFKVADLVPAVDQVEWHPYLQQPDLIKYCQERGIHVEAWAPLMRGQVLADPLIEALAAKYARTPSQIVIRWELQREIVTIPKSVHKERIVENAGILGFELDPDDMEAMNALDRGYRTGSDPDTFTF